MLKKWIIDSIFYGSNRKNQLMSRIFYTIVILIIYRIGAYLPLPNLNIDILTNSLIKENSLLDTVDWLLGGSIGRMSIFSLNLIPLVTANILFNLLSFFYNPIKKLKDNKNTLKLTKLVQYGSIIIGLIQSQLIIIYLYYYVNINYQNQLINGDFIKFNIVGTISLIVGYVILQWLASKITKYGVGNGISVIFVAGIIAELPKHLIMPLINSNYFGKFIFLFIFLMMTYIIILVETSKIKLPIVSHQFLYSKNKTKYFLLDSPLNIMGIMPIIIYQTSFTILKDLNFINQYPLLFKISLLYFCCLFYYKLISSSQIIYKFIHQINLRNLFFNGLDNEKNETFLYINLLNKQLFYINTLYLLILCLFPQFIFSLFNLNQFLESEMVLRLTGATLFIIIRIIISLIFSIRDNYLSSHSKNILRN